MFFGVMTTAQEQALLSIHFLDQADLDTIQQQSQNESPVKPVYGVSGPGTFRISAASLSLGK